VKADRGVADLFRGAKDALIHDRSWRRSPLRGRVRPVKDASLLNQAWVWWHAGQVNASPFQLAAKLSQVASSLAMPVETTLSVARTRRPRPSPIFLQCRYLRHRYSSRPYPSFGETTSGETMSSWRSYFIWGIPMSSKG
jgi:hypothetical protein